MKISKASPKPARLLGRGSYCECTDKSKCHHSQLPSVLQSKGIASPHCSMQPHHECICCMLWQGSQSGGLQEIWENIFPYFYMDPRITHRTYIGHTPAIYLACLMRARGQGGQKNGSSMHDCHCIHLLPPWWAPGSSPKTPCLFPSMHPIQKGSSYVLNQYRQHGA